MPGFPLGLSTIIFYYNLFLIYINYILIPSLSLILESIKPLFFITLLLSPNLFKLSIINQIIILLYLLIYIYIKPTLLLLKKILLFQEVLLFL
jgi:hypothetical protein